VVGDTTDLDDAIGEQLEQVESVDDDAFTDHDVECGGRAVGVKERQACGPDEVLQEMQFERRPRHDPTDPDDDAASVRDQDVGIARREGRRDRLGGIGRGGPCQHRTYGPDENERTCSTQSHADPQRTTDARWSRCSQPTRAG